MAALRNSKHEAFCREVAGGMTEQAAWIAIGNNAASNNVGRLAKRPDIVARIAELRAEFNVSAGIQLRWLQEKLMSIATADVTRYFEGDREGKLSVRDVSALPAEVRAALAELRVDADGRVSVKTWNKTDAINSLIKTIGGFAPQKLEISGGGGRPIEVEVLDNEAAIDLVRQATFFIDSVLAELRDHAQQRAWLARSITAVCAPALAEPTDGATEAIDNIPPIDRARAALVTMGRAAMALSSDAEAAAFMASSLREIAVALEDLPIGNSVNPPNGGFNEQGEVM